MKTASPILILGARGKTGQRLAPLLREAGQALRLGTRSPTAPDEVAFDWADKDGAIAAFDGVEAAYVVAPTDRTDHAEVMIPVLEQAIKAGTRRLVLLSAASLERGGPMMGQIHDYLAHNAPEWAVLRPSWFMQNLAEPRHMVSARTLGCLYTAAGEGRVAFIDAGDIARVAAVALTSLKPLNRDLILTGPQSLTYAEVAHQLGHHLGHEVRHVSLSVPQLARRLELQGLPSDYAQLLAGMDQAIADGPPEVVSFEVLTLTGQPPRSFADCMASDPAFAP